MRGLCIILCILSAAVTGRVFGYHAETYDTETARSNARARLAAAHTAADSIAPLYDLFDLALIADIPVYGNQLYNTALHAEDDATALDMLRQLTIYYAMDDSMLNVIHERITRIPVSEDQREALTFNNIYIADLDARAADTDERVADLQQVMQQYTLGAHDDDDLYTRIERLFTLCSYLQGQTEGALLVRYYGELKKLIDRLPAGSGNALRNQFYTFAAMAYTNNGNRKDAIAADRRQLSLIDEYEHQYARQGRKYRRYDAAEYTIYRRMLYNYQELTDTEIEEYYKILQQLCDARPGLKADREANRRIDIYYYMATQRYADALPLLKEQLAKARYLRDRLYLLRSMITAAEAVGDNETMNMASRQYIGLLEEFIDNKTAERYRELQFMYDTAGLLRRNAELELTAERTRTDNIHTLLIVAVIAIFILAVALVFAVRYSRRARQLTLSLKSANDTLRVERDRLSEVQNGLIAARDEAREAVRQKNNFVNNISHEALAPLNTIVEYSLLLADYIDEDRRRYTTRFTDTITHNALLVQNLVNEILEIGAIDNAGLVVSPEATALEPVCTHAVTAIRPRVRDGISLVYDPANIPSVIVNTDPKRVEQIILNLLDNAVKFTTSGTITLTAAMHGDTVAITVTDTGIGIPADRHEPAFERFEKLGRSSSGIGLGLSISRHLAQLLGGTLTIDPAYTAGLRITLSIPAR